MGRYSYSQPSSSSASVDITSLLEAEAQIYADEAQSSFGNGEPFQNQPQPEGDDGIPTICYCGSEPVVATAYTEKDPGRRYFTCNNVVDGATHIWKWLDDAVLEEMRDFQTEIRRLKEAVAEREQKLLLLEKTLYDAGKETTRVKLMVCLLVVIGLVILVLQGKLLTYLHFIFSLCVCIKTFDCLMLLICRSSCEGFNGDCSITCPMAKKVKVLCFSFLSVKKKFK